MVSLWLNTGVIFRLNNLNFHFQIQFMLLFSRQGKCRLQKWFVSQTDKNKKKITRELIANVLTRKPKMCSFLEWKDLKIVYKRYETSAIFGLISQIPTYYVQFSDMLVYISVLLLSSQIMNWWRWKSSTDT